MKHNEFKAFFKKRLEEAVKTAYKVVSVDETLSSRDLYLLDIETLETKYWIKCWFGTNDYSISIFNQSVLNKDPKEFHIYKDHCYKCTGSYKNCSALQGAILFVKPELPIPQKLQLKAKADKKLLKAEAKAIEDKWLKEEQKKIANQFGIDPKNVIFY